MLVPHQQFGMVMTLILLVLILNISDCIVPYEQANMRA
jgi:hypothetical protein